MPYQFDRKQIPYLAELQRLDTEIRKVTALIEKIPEKLTDLDRELTQRQQSLEAEEDNVKELKKRYRAYESDVQSNLSRIGKSNGRLASVKTNKEYQSTLKEIDDIEAINSKLEDEMLLILDGIDREEEALLKKKKELAEIAATITSEKTHLDQEADVARNQLGGLQAEFERTRPKIDAELLEIYQRVKSLQANGLGIAAVRHAVCQGCNLNIPPQMFNELQRGDRLKTCPNCERIIYWDDKDERSE
jgi:predicted  nucleic acid-binding Zn-ribbon protein